MNEHALFLLVMLLGHVAHIIKTVVQLRESDDTISLKKYIIQRPYKTSLALCGSLIGYIMLNDSGQLTLVAAMSVGYMADSVFDIASQKTRTQL